MPFSPATQGLLSLRDLRSIREASSLWALLSPAVVVESGGLLSEHSLQIPEEGLVSGDLQAQGRVSTQWKGGGDCFPLCSVEGSDVGCKASPTASQCVTTKATFHSMFKDVCVLLPRPGGVDT